LVITRIEEKLRPILNTTYGKYIGKKYQNDISQWSPYIGLIYKVLNEKIPQPNYTTPQITKIKIKATVTL
jgi:hypothetical protein